jgi:hypothetical protein
MLIRKPPPPRQPLPCVQTWQQHLPAKQLPQQEHISGSVTHTITQVSPCGLTGHQPPGGAHAIQLFAVTAAQTSPNTSRATLSRPQCILVAAKCPSLHMAVYMW